MGGTSKGPSERQRELGQRVREQRHKRKLSQEQLAALAGLDRSYIGQIETGRRNSNLDTLCKLAIGLDIDVARLVRRLETYKGRS